MVGEVAESARLARDIADRLLLPDRIEPASDLSSPFARPAVEFRGLSVLLPGILDRSALKDRVESFVSDLLNEGIDDIRGPLLSKEVDDALFLGVEAPEPPLDG